MVTFNRAVVIGLVAMAAFAVWRVALPAEKRASDATADAAIELLDTRTDARFAVAELNLQSQFRVTGSFAGAAMPGGAVLVRADTGGFCVQVGPPGTVWHLAGPGGAATAGSC